MRHDLCLILLCLVLFPSIVFAQELGQQGTDPFTGLPVSSGTPRNPPTLRGRESPSADEERHLVIKSRTVLVEVPAVVTDTSGNHVHNLAKDNFKILQNGKQRKISLFEEGTVGNDRSPQLLSPPGIFSNPKPSPSLRKGLVVRARNGFLVTNTTVDPQVTHQADLGFALTSPFDSTGIPLAVQWRSVVPSGEKKRVEFALHLPAINVIDEADGNRFDLDFIAQATGAGSAVAKWGQTAKGVVPDASLAKIKAQGIFYKNALELPPGDYEVRFVVRDNLSGRIGSVSAPLAVN